MRVLFVIAIALLTSCNQKQEEVSGLQLQLADVLGGENTEGFQRAEQPHYFSFPEDHALHDGFRNEWWYLTGNLQTSEGRRFGYQLTFFNATFSPSSSPLNPSSLESTTSTAIDSTWSGNRIWMAHAAVTDQENNQHHALERFSRENPGLAGAQINPLRIWLENWSIQSQSNEFPWQVSLSDEDFSFAFTINPEKDLVLQGVDGLSQKSPESGNASYYYSFTRLQTEGELTLNDEVIQVTGESWLDREWSTSALSEDQTGWDWFSLQFNDNQELMYYQLRDQSGRPHSSSQGNWTDQTANQTLIQTTDVHLKELKSWVSHTGISYTTEWLMNYQGNNWLITAVMEDQLMNVSLQYWEGAVDVFDAETEEKVGQGFLEMMRE